MPWPRDGGIRVLTIVDAFTRECPALEVDTSLSSQRVTRSLEQGGADSGADRKRSVVATG